MSSSWIQDLSYDSLTGNLTMETKSGASYIYEDVLPQTASDWQDADSPGSFHNANIRGNFEFALA